LPRRWALFGGPRVGARLGRPAGFAVGHELKHGLLKLGKRANDSRDSLESVEGESDALGLLALLRRALDLGQALVKRTE
jgi:hypothetical protein